VTSPPPVPDIAREVFGDRWPLAALYAELLATDGVLRGLIGPREAPRVWERHLFNCALLTELLALGADVCDIGSGAGLPGVVLAISRPDLRVTLVEPLLRRTTFLTEVVGRLGLENVTVVRDRAENLHGTVGFDVVTSRAVAPLPRLLAWSMPLVLPGGCLLALKGSSAREEVVTSRADLSRWRVASTQVEELGGNPHETDRHATVIVVKKRLSTRLGWAPTKGRHR
jgi:16S rRNA (guanine527-N7)-methyltransferase